MTKKILWLDNDPGYIKPFALVLEEAGFEVIVIPSALEAEREIKSQFFDLLILDVMIPTISDEEEVQFSPDDTDMSLRTGLVFYRRNKEMLEHRKIPVLVMTVRIDKAIKASFLEEGLPQDYFVTKMELRNSSEFVAKIKQITQPRAEV